MSSSAANNFKWTLMEPFVSNRDETSFPDESEAPVRASGTTSWNAPFSVAMKLAEPPEISRMYAHLSEISGGQEAQLLSLFSTHQNLALFRVSRLRGLHGEPPAVQDLFIFDASDLSLKLLPHCTASNLDDHNVPILGLGDFRLGHGQRLMPLGLTGLLCRGQDFVVADATLLVRGRKHNKVHVDLFWLRASSADTYSRCKWSCVRKPLLGSSSSSSTEEEFRWKSYSVIPFRHWLCWIDYGRGILFGDMFKHSPSVTLVRLPPEEEFVSTQPHNLWMYRAVSAIDARRCLKFVKVDRHDGLLSGPLKVGAGFTVTCHTLLLEGKLLKGKVWEKDYSVTSQELWSANPPEKLPRGILWFPQVNIDRPHVLHFLVICNSMYTWKKIWVVTIDMNTKKVESCFLYIKGWEARKTADGDLFKQKSLCPEPFLPCGFSEFLHLSSGMLGRDLSKRKSHTDEVFEQSERKLAKQGRPSSSRNFTGTGRLLTGETVEHDAPEPQEEIVHNIYFWRNGFTVNDGPLRSFDDPANASFLKSIKDSVCPTELEPADGKSKVDVNLVQKEEEFTEPVKLAAPSEGGRRTLMEPSEGGRRTLMEPSDNNTSNAAASTSVTAPRTIAVDDSLPSTSLQIRFADGSQLAALHL